MHIHNSYVSIRSFCNLLAIDKMAEGAETIFNTRNVYVGGAQTLSRSQLQTAIRWIHRYASQQAGLQPLDPNKLVRLALSAAGVLGSATTLTMQTLYNKAVQALEANKTEDEQGIREVAIGNDGSVVNSTPTTQPATTSSTKRLREEQPAFDPRTGKKGRQHTTPAMDIPMIEDGEDTSSAMVSFAAVGGSANNPVSKETPITNAPSISYGLQETHTTIIPFNFWFSAVGLNHSAPAKLQFRLNSIDDIVITQLSTLAASGTWALGTGTPLIYNVPFNGSTTRGSTNPATFPRTITNGASTTERGWWSGYWKKLYEYYTVLGCEYKITVVNGFQGTNYDISVAQDFDSYSDTAGSTGNVTPDTDIANMMAFKHINWTVVKGLSAIAPNKNAEVIQGRYKPGQISRNISNDGDVKTWTKTDGTLPTLKDICSLRFYRAPLNQEGFAQGPLGCNVQVELKYIVQFKDLKLAARYPYNGATDIVTTLEDDALDAV